MIIESIRLKNIKSYGEGPHGNGIVIKFAPGTNRIAGLNGHGKTTLIEAIGYVLFGSEPAFEETFKIDTYFLRSGKKIGEIDVQFQHERESYRVERGIGSQSLRRNKVVQVNDGSICAEGDEEVRRFLCRLFDFERHQQMAELFAKLVGVRQGRLTWPFDSTPTDAKRFFEPLLQVAVFRDCYDRLKPVRDNFVEQIHEQDKLLATVDERLRERESASKLVQEKRIQCLELERRVKELKEAYEVARKLTADLEQRERLIKEAERQLDSARAALNLARQHFETASMRMKEATAADGIIAGVTAAFQAYEEAEKRLRHHRSQQQTQSLLEKQKNDEETKQAILRERLNAACEQVEVLGRQRRDREALRTSFYRKTEMLQSNLIETRPAFELQENDVNWLTRDVAEIGHFIRGMRSGSIDRTDSLRKIETIQAILRTWNSAASEEARRGESIADGLFQEVHQRFVEARSGRAALKMQLDQIAGGSCPFLKEQCRQFDPAKVEADLGKMEQWIEALEREESAAKAKLDAARSERERIDREAVDIAAKTSTLDGLINGFVGSFRDLFPAVVRDAVARVQEHLPDLGSIEYSVPPPPADSEYALLAAAHEQALLFQANLSQWVEKADSKMEQRLVEARSEQRSRDIEGQNLVHYKTQLEEIEKEIARLISDESKRREAVDGFEKESRELVRRLADLDQKLKEFVPLGSEISNLERVQQDTRGDHQRYLGAKPLADLKISRESELKSRQNELDAATTLVKEREAASERLRERFDPAALSEARLNSEQRAFDVARESTQLANANEELKREEKRLQEGDQARAAKHKIVIEIARLQASIGLTELARGVLKASAPAVAQHLCDRIALHAQKIFNQLNREPIELNWEAMPRYSLRIVPGDRRFAMLSGGEQTKLALAMTLAMIQQFSGLRFCIFDEPTYGVDAESRERLAESILKSEEAAGLDQLIIVSHDDVFNSRIEQSIILKKRADFGTEVEMAFSG
jgi:exonuclease SbcC